MIETRRFGKTADGRETLAFTLRDGDCSATVLSLGGIVQSLVVPDRNGNPTDVVLGYADVEGYERNRGYLGALIGRFGNRIAGGRLVLDGKEYRLYCNDRGNHLHGGQRGFDKKIWEGGADGGVLRLAILSPDGEENYPGNLKVCVEYTLRDGELKISYRALSDRKTAVNLTNHTYFNLGGEGSGTVLDHTLWLDSDTVVPTDPAMIPVGDFRSVAGTPFDFNTPKTIGRDIGADDEDLKRGNGYDHCFLLKNRKREFVRYAVAESPRTGIVMSCFTDLPAVQLYTGNGLKQQGKTAYYGPRSAFCLETQAIPNNVNVPAYADIFSSVLEAGETFCSSTSYRFGR